MKIKSKINQYRRDFTAIYECEGCGYSESSSGYDDRNFHDNVIPAFKCPKCEKSSIDLGTELKHTETVYPDGMQI